MSIRASGTTSGELQIVSPISIEFIPDRTTISPAAAASVTARFNPLYSWSLVTRRVRCSVLPKHIKFSFAVTFPEWILPMASLPK